MERALLCLVSEGNLDDEDEDSDNKKTSKPSFTEALWGEKTHFWVATTKRLKAEEHWKYILEEAAAIALPDANEGDSADEFGTDPRMLIELWYGFVHVLFT
jgi:hypothetical protein